MKKFENSQSKVLHKREDLFQVLFKKQDTLKKMEHQKKMMSQIFLQECGRN